MIIQVDLLNEPEVLDFRRRIVTAPFREGRATAGPAAEGVKNNQQARGDDLEVRTLGALVRTAMESHPLVRSSIRPVRWSRMMFSRYEVGQHYGAHTDNATIEDDAGWPLRTDVSFTLFLSPPETYDGGALLIHDSGGDREFKLKAGSAVFYSTSQIHQVLEVTRGTRLACVGWVQSQIRRSDRREMLFDLERVRSGTHDADAALSLDKTIGNLIRMWGES